MRVPLVFALALLMPAAPVHAEDWAQFRGPGGLGVSPDKGLPERWSDKENVAWKTELPGPGSSSPIVVGERIFVTCYSGYGLDANDPGDVKNLKRHLICLDRAGRVLWTRDVVAETRDQPYSGFQLYHGYASATPVSDGKHVYAFFGVAGVLAYDLDGKELWRSSVGTGTHGWGSGTSPVLAGDLVIVNASVESDALVALDRNSGKVAWTAKGMNYSWNTPLLVDVDDHQELVVSVYQTLLAYDPKSGAELWRCQGIEDYVCPSLVAHKGVVYAIGGRQDTALAVKAGGKGDVSATHRLWTLNKGSNVSSPVYYQGHLYWASEGKGVVYCVDADKGKLVYQQRLQPAAELIYASATVGDGKFYYVSRAKGTYVVAAGPQFKLLAHNVFDGDTSVCNGSPAIADGRIYLRSDRFLYCIGKGR